MAAAQAEFPGESERFRFCTEALVRGTALPEAEVVRAALREKGDSLVVIRSADLLKVHLHTDEPEELFAYLRGIGTLVTRKAEDMQVQHAALGGGRAHRQLARRPVAILSDSACDLPEEVVRAHGIEIVPLNLLFGNEVLRDGVDISTREFTERLLEGAHPTTSQPTPAAFLDGYRHSAEEGEQIVAVLLSAALSGTYASAEAAARRFDAAPLTLIDSRAASLLQGLMVLKAAELAEHGRTPLEIVSELTRIRAQSGIVFTVDTFERLLASGRVGRGRAWLGTLLDIKPILEIDPTGKVIPIDRVRGRRNALPRVMEILEKRIPTGSRVRFGIVHVACEEILAEVSDALRARYGRDVEILTAPVSPVLATHIGPGAWGLAYMVED
jgi:DegV family protein with EDD domain